MSVLDNHAMLKKVFSKIDGFTRICYIPRAAFIATGIDFETDFDLLHNAAFRLLGWLRLF